MRRRPRPRNATDALVLATAFPHASRTQQNRILFEMAGKRLIQELIPLLGRELRGLVTRGDEALRDPEGRALIRAALTPLFARFGVSELLDRVLGAPPGATGSCRPEAGCPAPGDVVGERSFVLGMTRTMHEAENVAACVLELGEAVDPDSVTVEDLGNDWMRVRVRLRGELVGDPPHVEITSAYADLLKPAEGENRKATGTLQAHLLTPAEHRVKHLSLLVAQEIAPALEVPVVRPPAVPAPANVVPIKRPSAARPAAPAPSAPPPAPNAG